MTTAAERYDIKLTKTGTNGSAVWSVEITDTKEGRAFPAVAVSRANLPEVAIHLAKLMGEDPTVIQRDLAARLDSEDSLIPGFRCITELCSQHPELRTPVIQGLLREGETMNLIAAPKVGKSWLAAQLAISIAAGRSWFDRFAVAQGQVLILDNELHPETISHRVPKVAEAMGVGMSHLKGQLMVESFRGSLRDIFAMGTYFRNLESRRFKLIIIDAFYRILPQGMDENSNADLAAIYNQIDHHANHLNCAFCLIHHSSKGIQSGKAITDVGAGAGSQSRATDAHLVLRQHEEDGVVVLDAAVRSWKAIDAFCLRWRFPAWEIAEGLDPTLLRKEKRRARKEEREQPKEPKVVWTPEMFVAEFITQDPQPVSLVIAKAGQRELSERKSKQLIELAETQGRLYRWTFASRRTPHKLSIQPQPVTES